MRRVLLGVFVGMAVSAAPAWAYRMRQPPTFYEWNTNAFTDLNNALQEMWNISNGRYALDTLVVTPNGSRKGTKGEMVFAVFGGNNNLCVNTDSGTTWKCAVLS